MEAGVGGGLPGRDTWGRREGQEPAWWDARGSRNERGGLPGTCQDANRPRHSTSPGEGTVSVCDYLRDLSLTEEEPCKDSSSRRIRWLGGKPSDQGQAAGLIKRCCTTPDVPLEH